MADWKTEASHLLSQYIQHSSVTGNEKNAGEYFAGLCTGKGLIVRVLTDKTDSYNFAASLYPLETGKPNIILLNHIDVVQENDSSSWKYPPFSGAIVGDTVWGRGAIDMKGVAVMQLLAVSSYTGMAQNTDLPYNVTILCVSGEERAGITGAKIIINNFLSDLNPLVILGEGGIGTEGLIAKKPQKLIFCISLNDKRAAWISLHLKFETSGHSAIPPPESANTIMLKALNNLQSIKPAVHFNSLTREMLRSYGELQGGIAGFMLKRPDLFRLFIVPRLKKDRVLNSMVTNTIAITNISNHSNDINQIPQEIDALIDCRLLPETSTDEFLHSLRRKMKCDRIEIKIMAETIAAETTRIDNFYTNLEHSLIETYPGSSALPMLFPATTDNNFFRQQNIPVLGLVPANLDVDLIGTVHNYNERIPAEALGKGTEVYFRFLDKLLFSHK